MSHFPRARTLAVALPCALALGSVSGTATGAAFALKEQSATALGNAFAGATAGAEDITYSFFNPAALAWGSGTEVALVGSYILPKFEYESDEPAPYPGANRSKSEEAAFVPVGYAAWNLRDDIRMGIGVTVPYGLETDYDSDWVGRYDAINTDLMTVDINPSIAWRVNEQIAVAAGVSAQYADASLSSAVPAFSATGNPENPLAPVWTLRRMENSMLKATTGPTASIWARSLNRLKAPGSGLPIAPASPTI